MTVYDIKTRQKHDCIVPETKGAMNCAIFCSAGEIERLRDVFGWDESTTLACVHLDESVRYTSYDGYDFISLIHTDTEGTKVIQREVNVFFSKDSLVLVLPENEGERLSRLERRLRESVENGNIRTLPVLYYSIFNNLAANFSETLEVLEDEIEALSEEIPANSEPDQFHRIEQLRKAAYTLKKLLRALSYIGGQILMDENHLLDKAYIHYFSNINTRLMKLYDFADNLYSLSGELLHTYDSKSSVRLNETMTKLTVITLFFGPLTVITGIYGMNFSQMPELAWSFGYPAALGVMAAVSLIIYTILKKKKWL